MVVVVVFCRCCCAVECNFFMVHLSCSFLSAATVVVYVGEYFSCFFFSFYVSFVVHFIVLYIKHSSVYLYLKHLRGVWALCFASTLVFVQLFAWAHNVSGFGKDKRVLCFVPQLKKEEERKKNPWTNVRRGE